MARRSGPLVYKFEDYREKALKAQLLLLRLVGIYLTGTILQVKLSAICLTVCTVRLHATKIANSCLVCIGLKSNKIRQVATDH